MRPNSPANLLISLRNGNAASECFARAASSAKDSFDFGIGAKGSHVEEFTVGSGMNVHTVSGGAKGIGQEKREDDSKECQG